MKALVRSLIGAVIGFMLFAGVGIIVQDTYYRYMPAKWFLNYYYVKADNAVVGQPVQLTLCRHRRYDDIQLKATRTFLIYLEASGRQKQEISHYDFTANVQQSGDSNCTTVQLPPGRQPQRAGTFIVHTEAEFFVHGVRKVVSYDSLPYVITNTPASLEQRIKALEQELRELKEQLTAARSAAGISEPLVQSPSQQPATTPVQGNSSMSSSSPATGTNSPATTTSGEAGTTPQPASGMPLPVLNVLQIPLNNISLIQ